MKIKSLIYGQRWFLNSFKFHKNELIINLDGEDKYCKICDLIHENIHNCSSETNFTKKGNIYSKFKFNDENDYNKAVKIIESAEIVWEYKLD